MEYQDKVIQLKSIIEEKLTPLISKSYVLWDLPYYTNVGDTLIWEGTECFLQNLVTQCISKCAYQTFHGEDISDDVTILLQGGGNFGDVWRMHQDFRLKVIELYPNNKIIILPQSIYYENMDVLRADAELMGRHSHLTICGRDKKSFEILNTYFSNNDLLLLPDMAFCISPKLLTKYCKKSIHKHLWLKRKDIEFRQYNYEKYIQEEAVDIDVKDWPTVDSMPFSFLILDGLMKFHFDRIVDYYFIHYLKKYLLKNGVEFLSRYDKVYTTRLHVAILSILLNKPCIFFDNSYGKNRAFYEAWLKDVDNMYFIS